MCDSWCVRGKVKLVLEISIYLFWEYTFLPCKETYGGMLTIATHFDTLPTSVAELFFNLRV